MKNTNLVLTIILALNLTACLGSSDSGSAPAARTIDTEDPGIVTSPPTTIVTTPTTQPVVPPTTTTTTQAPQPYAYGGGQGTQAQPYILQTPDDIRHIADNPASYYWLNNNISMLNESFTTLPAFSGTIYGNNYTISKLDITSTASTVAAMFVSVSGTIVSLKLTNFKANGANYASGFAGVLTGTISSCSISGQITSTSGGNGYNTGTGNPIYVTKSGAASVVGTTMNVSFNGNTVTSIQ